MTARSTLRMGGRNESRVIDLEGRYEGCEKVYKSKGGLVQHQNRVHRASLKRATFECGRYSSLCETEVACLNHELTCGGESMGRERRECGECGMRVSRSNFARHGKCCRERRAGVAGEADSVGDSWDSAADEGGVGVEGEEL